LQSKARFTTGVAASSLVPVAGPAFADVAPPPGVAHGWPAWVVVALVFGVFFVLVYFLAKFVRSNKPPGRGGPDDAAPGL
jgi:heme/copper-type cytochrome/quinol oxidase subunit 2